MVRIYEFSQRLKIRIIKQLKDLIQDKVLLLGVDSRRRFIQHSGEHKLEIETVRYFIEDLVKLFDLKGVTWLVAYDNSATREKIVNVTITADATFETLLPGFTLHNLSEFLLNVEYFLAEHQRWQFKAEKRAKVVRTMLMRNPKQIAADALSDVYKLLVRRLVFLYGSTEIDFHVCPADSIIFSIVRRHR